MSAAAPIAREDVGPAVRARLSGFVRTLRDAGFKVGLAETSDALALLASPLARRRAALQSAFKALFSTDPADWQRFDDLFAAFWTGRGVRSVQRASGGSGKTRALDRAPLPWPGAEGAGSLPDHTERRAGAEPETAKGGSRREGASRAELLAATDIRHIADADQTARVHALTARLAERMRARIVRRERARAKGRRLDLRRTLHRSIPRGGTPLDLVWRQRKRKPLRIVALLDASGSMSLYTAFFVRFLHGLMANFREADVFLFHTRLVHVSPSLRDKDVGRAVDRLSLMAQGIGGGTKIGASLADFNRWHAKRMLRARTVLLIVSDGYDTGEPKALGHEMRRLRRRCRRIVWLNPLIGWRDYAPEARGMKAALPYVDLFAPAHNLDSLAALEPYLAKI